MGGGGTTSLLPFLACPLSFDLLPMCRREWMSRKGSVKEGYGAAFPSPFLVSFLRPSIHVGKQRDMAFY